LTVRITPKAIITFNYRFRWCGKQQRIKIGCYPDVRLNEAQVKIGEYRQALQEGLDPRSYATSHKEARLLGDVCCDFMEKCVLKELSPKTIVLYESFYKKIC